MHQRSSSGAWSSLTPRSSTALTLTGPRPPRLAAASPATTSSSRSRRVIVVKSSRRTVSRLTLTRSRPASASARAVRVRPSALVVIEISGRGVSAVVRRDDVGQPATEQRLAAGEPDLADAEALDRDA